MIQISLIITGITCVILIYLVLSFYERKPKNKYLSSLDITSVTGLVTVLLLIIPYVNIIVVCGYILYKGSNLIWDLPDILDRKVKSKLDEK